MKFGRMRTLLRLIKGSMKEKYKIDVEYYDVRTLKGSTNLQQISWRWVLENTRYHLGVTIFDSGAIKDDDVSDIALQTMQWLQFQSCNYYNLPLSMCEALLDVEKGLYTELDMSDVKDAEFILPLYRDKLIATTPQDDMYPFDVVLTEDGKEYVESLRLADFVEI